MAKYFDVYNENHSLPDSGMKTGVPFVVRQVNVDCKPSRCKILQKMIHDKSFAQLSSKKERRFA